MKKEIKLSFINNLENLNKEQWSLIQVIVGPRQVGKTTGVLQFLKTIDDKKTLYVSADGQLSQPASWLEEQWLILHSQSAEGILVIDEIQKVENWSETVKKLWDQQKRKSQKIRLILLGSSSLQIQKGLSESLTGRFRLQQVFHWNLEESLQAYGLDREQFLIYGGYPGSYAFIKTRQEWLNYLRESIINTVVGRDILSLSRVKSPALFRQSFELACAYGGQELSYNKMLGQLQDKGNVELVKGYLELFEGAFLLKQLFKFTKKKVLTRASSPKILPLCPALYSITLDADFNQEQRGRAFEIAVGCLLVRLPGHLYYWREGNAEVDYIYQYGKKIVAIEVKSGKKKNQNSLSLFLKKFPEAQALLVTPENFSTFIEKLK